MVSLFVNVLMLTVPLYMLQLFDRVLGSRSDETLLYLTLAAGIALVVMSALDVMRSRILVRVSSWLEKRLGPEALSRAVSGLLLAQSYGPRPCGTSPRCASSSPAPASSPCSMRPGCRSTCWSSR